MRKVDTQYITPGNALPIKAGTIQHLQNAHIETVLALALCLVGPSYDPTKVYILHGCVNIGVGSNNYNITSGAVLYAGEIYLVEAANLGVVVPPSVPLWQLNTSYEAGDSFDPTIHSDGIPRNVHVIRKLKVVGAFTGSGIDNFVNSRAVTINMGPGAFFYFFPPANNTGAYFDLVTGLGKATATRGLALCDGQVGRPNLKGRVLYGLDLGRVGFNVPMATGGADEVLLNEAHLPPHRHFLFNDNADQNTAIDLSAALPPARIKGAGAGTGNDNYEYAVNGSDDGEANVGLSSETGGVAGNAQAFNIFPRFIVAVPVIRLY